MSALPVLPQADPAAEWARCRHWIEAALEYDGGLYAIEDVEAAIQTGEAIFWPGFRSAVICQTWHMPRAKCLHFWLAGGDMDELLGDMRPVIERWAIENDYHKVILAGRKGWVRAMKPLGYDEIWTGLSKDLTK